MPRLLAVSILAFAVCLPTISLAGIIKGFPVTIQQNTTPPTIGWYAVIFIDAAVGRLVWHRECVRVSLRFAPSSSRSWPR